jgi:hypothetical protein
LHLELAYGARTADVSAETNTQQRHFHLLAELAGDGVVLAAQLLDVPLGVAHLLLLRYMPTDLPQRVVGEAAPRATSLTFDDRAPRSVSTSARWLSSGACA